MICITEIKVIDVDVDIDKYQIAYHEPLSYAAITDSDPKEYVEITTELITGRRFVNANGEEVCVGMSKQVQKYIGLPFEVYENLQNNIKYERKQTKIQRYKLDRVKSMTFWHRIKYAFTGDLLPYLTS